jgi:hypothetical protein
VKKPSRKVAKANVTLRMDIVDMRNQSMVAMKQTGSRGLSKLSHSELAACM